MNVSDQALADSREDYNLARIEAMLSDATWAEIELLAALADRPIASFRILEALGVTIDWFGLDDGDRDTAAIYLALKKSGAPGQERSTSKLETALRIRWLLERIGCYDEKDSRPYISGESRWGWPAIAALLCRVPFNEQHICECVDRVRRIRQRLSVIEDVQNGVQL